MGKRHSADTGNAAVEKAFRDRGYKGASYVVRDANAAHRPQGWEIKEAAPARASSKRRAG
ncbi:MAG TPA: hypothetical protein VNU01_01150 [Egibacteraceae bacterium]|nr:hypothetical protein [Egibacteraceae bacterium]